MAKTEQKLISIVLIAIIIFGSSSMYLLDNSTAEDDHNEKGVRIDSDDELLDFVEEENIEGEGTEQDPFIIENYVFEGDGNSFYMGNTTLHTDFKSCEFRNASHDDSIWKKGAGLLLHQSSNVRVIDSDFNNNHIGLLIRSSASNIVEDNNFEGNEVSISIEGSINNRFEGNSLYDGPLTITLDRETLANQIMVDNTFSGKPIEYYANENLGWMEISNAGQVIFANVSYATLQNLDLSDTESILAYSSDIDVSNSEFRSSPRAGLRIHSSNNITLENNIFEHGREGIILHNSDHVTVADNKIIDNGQAGLVLESHSNHNMISNNIIYNNGVTVGNSHNNTIHHNRIMRAPGKGMILTQGSSKNLIYENAFMYNNGIRELNNETKSQGRDDTSLNRWNSSDIGNHWSEWTEPDEDEDGMVDKAYNITGSDAKDYLPLVEPSMPVIPSHPRNASVDPGKEYLNIVWDEPRSMGKTELLGYRIYKGDEPTSFSLLEEIEDIGKFNYTDTEVEINETYYYRLSAFNDVGESLHTQVMEGSPDDVSPEIEIIYPYDGYYTNKDFILLEWNVTDDNSGVEDVRVRLDEGDWFEVPPKGTHRFENLTEGEYIIRMEAVDRAGNEANISLQIFVDHTIPEVLYARPRGDEVSRDFVIDITFSEEMDQGSVNISSDKLSIGNHTWVDEDRVRAAPENDVEYGTNYTIFVNGSDLAGNELEETYSWSFTTMRSGNLTGVVVDHRGDPIHDVKVELESGDVVFTNHDGRFKIETYAGEYEITFQKERYQTVKREVTVPPGEEMDLGEIRMYRIRTTSLDIMMVISSIVIVVAGGIALAVFFTKKEELEDLEFDEEELYEEEETDYLPPEFLE